MVESMSLLLPSKVLGELIEVECLDQLGPSHTLPIIHLQADYQILTYCWKSLRIPWHEVFGAELAQVGGSLGY